MPPARILSIAPIDEVSYARTLNISGLGVCVHYMYERNLFGDASLRYNWGHYSPLMIMENQIESQTENEMESRDMRCLCRTSGR